MISFVVFVCPLASHCVRELFSKWMKFSNDIHRWRCWSRRVGDIIVPTTYIPKRKGRFTTSSFRWYTHELRMDNTFHAGLAQPTTFSEIEWQREMHQLCVCVKLRWKMISSRLFAEFMLPNTIFVMLTRTHANHHTAPIHLSNQATITGLCSW